MSIRKNAKFQHEAKIGEFRLIMSSEFQREVKIITEQFEGQNVQFQNELRQQFQDHKKAVRNELVRLTSLDSKAKNQSFWNSSS